MAVQLPLSLTPILNPGPLPGSGTLSEDALTFLLSAEDDSFQVMSGGGGASSVEFECVDGGTEVEDVKVWGWCEEFRTRARANKKGVGIDYEAYG